MDGRFPIASSQNRAAGQWLRANPHRLHLGRIGLSLSDSNGKEISLNDLQTINQSVDLWQGIIQSGFAIEGETVSVETACHPDIDQISVRIQSKLLQSGQIGIQFAFPYGSTAWGKNAADWNSPDAHHSDIVSQNDQSVSIKRTLDSDSYFTDIHWSGNATFTQKEKHTFSLSITDTGPFEFSARFSKTNSDTAVPLVSDTFHASKTHWQNFWESGGAVDLSLSKDSRAQELERRIVLSQYLTAVQCRGELPPSETGRET